MALFNPKVIYPQTGAVVDPTTALTFKWQVKGSSPCVAYQCLILDISNVAVYTGTKQTLSTPLYKDQYLEIPFLANATLCTVGNSYKHKILMYYTDTLYVTSGEIIFHAYTTPTLSINMPSTSPHNLQYFTFTLNYTQAQGIPIKQFNYKLYNNSMEQIGSTYTQIGTSLTDYFVDGLVSGNTYFIQAELTTQNVAGSSDGFTIVSDVEEFSVLYNPASLTIIPTVTNNPDYDALDINITVSQINGVPSSESGYQYVPNYIYVNNTGVNIYNGETITYDIDIPANFTMHYVFGIDYGYTGDLITLSNYLHTYVLSYDGTNLVYEIDNVATSTYDISSYDITYWHVTLLPTEAIFRFIVSTELAPSSTLAPSVTLFPLKLTE